MKAISIRQPWAGLIMAGLKTIETRGPSFTTKYLGPLFIHAAKTRDDEAWVALERKMGPLPTLCGIRGALIGVGILINNRPMTKRDEPFALCDWYRGARALVIVETRRILPIALRGQLGIFETGVRTFRVQPDEIEMEESLWERYRKAYEGMRVAQR